MESTKYFSDSWKLITRDKGWMKPILVMSAASLVPIAGYLGNKGYVLEYARLTSWGIDAAPKQKNVNVTACIKSGWRGFVVELGLGFLLTLPIIILSIIAGVLPDRVGRVAASLIQLVGSFYSILVAIVLCVAQIRAAIYETIGAGYKFQRVKELIQRDTHGLTKVLLIQLVGSIIMSVLIGICVVVVLIPLIPTIAAVSSSAYGGYTSQNVVALAVVHALVWILPIVAIFGFAISFVTNLLQLIIYNAVGLWMRQFNVPSWGNSDDPLPQNVPNTNQYQQQAYRYQSQQPYQQSPNQQQPYSQQPHQQQSYQQQAPASQQPAPMPVVLPARTEGNAQPEPEPEPSQETMSVIETVPLARKPDDMPESEPVAANEAEVMAAPEQVPVAESEQMPVSELESEPSPAFEQETSSVSATAETERIEIPTEVLPAQNDDDEPTVEDLYNDLSDAIKENDRVPEDDE